jgi:hypothetical protein
MRWWEPLAVVPVVACLGWLIVLFALGFILGVLFAFLGYGAEVSLTSPIRALWGT